MMDGIIERRGKIKTWERFMMMKRFVGKEINTNWITPEDGKVQKFGKR